MNPASQVVLVEDDPRTRATLARLISAWSEFQVVAQAASVAQGIELLHTHRPSLVLLDLELPDGDGLSVLSAIKPKQPGCEVLVLTSFEDEDRVFAALQLGASGYLVKSASMGRLREAMQAVVAHGVVIEPKLARRFWNAFEAARAKPSLPSPLSPEEVAVLLQVARGLTNREGSQAVTMSERHFRTCLAGIYTKLGTSSRAGAVTCALKNGWLDFDAGTNPAR